jgi:hypothetical protein
MTNEEAFECACWDFKRAIRTTEPTAAEFNLDYHVAEAIARKCHWEFERKRIEAIKKSAMAA